jgi:formamidopyrimidine-DNA glycosylase
MSWSNVGAAFTGNTAVIIFWRTLQVKEAEYNELMPELPEVETIAAGLHRKAAGRVIEDIRVFLPKLLREGPISILDTLRGIRILGVGRRGKLLVISCEGDRRLLFHLKMTGQFLWADPVSPRDRHTHLVIRFKEYPRELRFRDVRKFGFVRFHCGPDLSGCAEISTLGPEPLEISRRDFIRRLSERRGRLKSLFLNQTFIAGIGNIYADEILFSSRLHPLTNARDLKPTEAGSLWSAMRSVLGRAVAAGGSSIRDYKDDDGSAGSFQFDHRAYGRAGFPCRRCGTAIRRVVVGGRATFFCPRCQKRRISRN